MKFDYLRRLPPEYYRGNVFVHWSMTIDERKTSWLTQYLHNKVRELLLHTIARYRLACPIYCLMPDHMHIFWIGLVKQSDQLRAASFFRKFANRPLHEVGCRFQKQGHDNVLREKDRERNAVLRLIYYISENPVRAELVKSAREWPFSGSLVVGYPDMDWRDETFGERFWQVYEMEVEHM